MLEPSGPPGALLSPCGHDGCWLPLGRQGSGLLRPPLLHPAELLLSWVLCGQSSRLLGRPWRQGENRAEGPRPPGGSDSRDPETRLRSTSSQLPSPPQPACTHSPLSRGFCRQKLVPADPWPALLTCTLPVPTTGISWSSAFGCLKGRVTGSEAGPVPQARSPPGWFWVGL